MTLRFFRSFACSDLDIDSRDARRRSRFIFESLPSSQYPVCTSIGPKRPPFCLDRSTGPKRQVHLLGNIRSVLGMNHALPSFLRTSECSLSQAVHLFKFRAPSVFIGLEIPFECADSRSLLSETHALLVIV